MEEPVRIPVEIVGFGSVFGVYRYLIKYNTLHGDLVKVFCLQRKIYYEEGFRWMAVVMSVGKTLNHQVTSFGHVSVQGVYGNAQSLVSSLTGPKYRAQVNSFFDMLWLLLMSNSYDGVAELAVTLAWTIWFNRNEV